MSPFPFWPCAPLFSASFPRQALLGLADCQAFCLPSPSSHLCSGECSALLASSELGAGRLYGSAPALIQISSAAVFADVRLSLTVLASVFPRGRVAAAVQHIRALCPSY